VEEAQPSSPSSALPSSVTVIEHEGATYYLIGTAHVSKQSVDDVRAVIDAVKPDVVCVELDKVRHEALTKDSAFRDLDVFKVVREGRTLYLLAHLALASYQRRIGATLGVKPGAELLAAVEAANERGIPVELIDRDMTTMTTMTMTTTTRTRRPSRRRPSRRSKSRSSSPRCSPSSAARSRRSRAR
jgi:pheromone shutdown protein TraB